LKTALRLCRLQVIVASGGWGRCDGAHPLMVMKKVGREIAGVGTAGGIPRLEKL